MKKFAIAAVAVSMVSTPAFAADTDTTDIVVNATVLEECSIETPGPINMGDLSINEAPGSTALLLDEVAQSDVANLWMSCNYDADITLSTANRALETTSPVTDTAQFTDRIFYGIRLQPTVPGAFVASNSFKPRVQPPARTFTQTAEFHDNAELQITLEQLNVNNKRPVAGTYTDTITITLGTV